MEPELLNQLDNLLKTADSSVVIRLLVENQRIVNKLARIGLAHLEGTEPDDEDIPQIEPTEPEVKHTDVAKDFGVEPRTIRRHCMEPDGRIKQWRHESERIIKITESEVERVRPLFKQDV